MSLWKHLLEMSSCRQNKCFASSHLFSICGDSQNDLYVFLNYIFTKPTEKREGGSARLGLSACMLLANFMDSKPSRWVFTRPTSMWWWSRILQWQQIPPFIDPSPEPRLFLIHTWIHSVLIIILYFSSRHNFCIIALFYVMEYFWLLSHKVLHNSRDIQCRQIDFWCL